MDSVGEGSSLPSTSSGNITGATGGALAVVGSGDKPKSKASYKRKRRDKELRGGGGDLHSMLVSMAASPASNPSSLAAFPALPSASGVVLIADAYSGLFDPTSGSSSSSTSASFPLQPQISQPLPAPPKKRVVNACAPCQRSHVSCSGNRPCLRCVRRNEPLACQDAPKKERAPSFPSASSPSSLPSTQPRKSHRPHVSTPPPMSTSSMLASSSSTSRRNQVAADSEVRVLKPILPRPTKISVAPNLSSANALMSSIPSDLDASSSTAGTFSPMNTSTPGSPFVFTHTPTNMTNTYSSSNDSGDLLCSVAPMAASASLPELGSDSSVDAMLLDFGSLSTPFVSVDPFDMQRHMDKQLLSQQYELQPDQPFFPLSQTDLNKSSNDFNFPNLQTRKDIVLLDNHDFNFLNWLGFKSAPSNPVSSAENVSSSLSHELAHAAVNPLSDGMSSSGNALTMLTIPNALAPNANSAVPPSSSSFSDFMALRSLECVGDSIAAFSCPMAPPALASRKPNGNPSVMIGADLPDNFFAELDGLLNPATASNLPDPESAAVATTQFTKRSVKRVKLDKSVVCGSREGEGGSGGSGNPASGGSSTWLNFLGDIADWAHAEVQTEPLAIVVCPRRKLKNGFENLPQIFR